MASIPREKSLTLRSAWGILGAKFWFFAITAFVGLSLILAEVLIEYEAFEAFYEYTRSHESWQLDDIAMAVLASVIAMVFVGAFVTTAVTRKLISKEIERQEASLRIERSQRLIALGTLLGGTAHSLNNHLLPVIALSDLVRSDCAQDTPHAKDLEMISIAARRAVEMIQKLKIFARANEGMEGNCLVGPATSAAIELAQKVAPSSVKFLLSIDKTPARVGVSETALEIVILNLINNAVDAMEGMPGTIEIKLNLVSHLEKNDRRDGVASSAWVRIQINDTGKGMGLDESKRIFEPFFTTKPVGTGTGLGLSETYGIVDKAGGKFDVKSEIGVGSQIGILLPLIEDAHSAHPANI